MAALVAVGIVATVAGCGGGGSGGTTAAARSGTEDATTAGPSSQAGAEAGSGGAAKKGGAGKSPQAARSKGGSRLNREAPEAGKPRESRESSKPAEPPAAKPPSAKEQFVRRAGAICVRERERGLARVVPAVKRRQGKPGSGGPAALAKLERAAFLSAIQAQVGEIRKLDAPSGDRKQVSAILDAMQAAVREERLHPLPPGAPREARFRRSGELASAYGLSACAYG